MKTQLTKLLLKNINPVTASQPMRCPDLSVAGYILKGANSMILKEAMKTPHEYQPIGTGECWICGKAFHIHIAVPA